MRYNGDGPAVMLGDSTSLFPAQLAADWRSRGMEVSLVTNQRDAPPALPDGTRIVRSADYETPLTRRVTRWLLNPILYRLEKPVPRFKRRFKRITGVSADSELWLPYFASYVTSAWPAFRAVRAQHPRFVFGHEVTTYGLATALCRGIPRIMFPWGGDVFTYAESSPYQFALTKFSLRAADLIVPGSVTGARHICERFAIRPEKVHPIWWGVDRKIFKSADGEQRNLICSRWNIDPRAMTILNPRRFRPAWGALVALDAFMQVATESPLTHFILFGGKDTEEFTAQARTKLEEEGLSARFTILQGNAPLDVCAELMSISDVFVSLIGRGDMRSSSVLQAAASGAVPVIVDHPEYRAMEQLGFNALFVRPENVEDVVNALRFYINNPEKAREIVARNDDYLIRHEDYSTQMDKLLSLIEEVCVRYAAR